MRYAERKCLMCKSPFRGRTDKKYCTTRCKSTYHKKLSAHTHRATRKIDKILHRNRSILQELLGKRVNAKQVAKEDLDAKGFSFTHFTGCHRNTQNKMIYFVYDFSWMRFSDNNLYIKRIRK